MNQRETTERRTFLKVLGGIGAAAVTGAPVLRALAEDKTTTSDEFFVLIHAQGGWDVTLWSDPRNEDKGLVDPATDKLVNTEGLRRWVDDAEVRPGERTFKKVQPAGSKLVFGPGIGDLADLYDRITLFNGVAVNTVSHPDGTAFAATGRHLAGGRVPASSLDSLLANEFGTGQLLPAVSAAVPLCVHRPDPRSTRDAADGRRHRLDGPLARAHQPQPRGRRPRRR